jgi:hypothetical protein
MRFRFLSSIAAAAFLTAAVFAQDASSPPPAGQNSGQGNGGGYGQRGVRGGGMGGARMGMMGRGVLGTVTEMATDHFTVKTEMGEVYTLHFTSDTRFTKQQLRSPGGDGQGMGGGYGRGANGGNPQQEIKATDIKVGDAIGAMGEIDATAKSVGATRIVLLDPETAKRMQEMAANYGKTWLQGKVTAISGATITLTGSLDNAPHTVIADENTTFRSRRDPVTLADIQVGDTIRVEGALKNGTFAATTVNVGATMGGPPRNGSSGPPAGGPTGPPPSAPPQ